VRTVVALGTAEVTRVACGSFSASASLPRAQLSGDDFSPPAKTLKVAGRGGEEAKW